MKMNVIHTLARIRPFSQLLCLLTKVCQMLNYEFQNVVISFPYRFDMLASDIAQKLKRKHFKCGIFYLWFFIIKAKCFFCKILRPNRGLAYRKLAASVWNSLSMLWISVSPGAFAFEPAICRSLGLTFQQKTKKAGLPAYLFELNIGEDLNVKQCFCRTEEECPPKGTIDLFRCTGVPMIGSHPHFYYAEELLDGIESGLAPDKDKHGVYMYIEIVSRHCRLNWKCESIAWRWKHFAFLTEMRPLQKKKNHIKRWPAHRLRPPNDYSSIWKLKRFRMLNWWKQCRT